MTFVIPRSPRKAIPPRWPFRLVPSVPGLVAAANCFAGHPLLFRINGRAEKPENIIGGPVVDTDGNAGTKSRIMQFDNAQGLEWGSAGGLDMTDRSLPISIVHRITRRAVHTAWDAWGSVVSLPHGTSTTNTFQFYRTASSDDMRVGNSGSGRIDWLNILASANTGYESFEFTRTGTTGRDLRAYINGILQVSGAAGLDAAQTGDPNLHVNASADATALHGDNTWSDTLLIQGDAKSWIENRFFYDQRTRWSMYEEYGRRLYFMPVEAGGVTHDEAVAETITFADTSAETAGFAATSAETLTLADPTSELADFVETVAEALTLADAGDTAGSTFVRVLSETLNLADAATKSLEGDFQTFVAESLSLADAATETADFAVGVAETLTFTDLVTRIATMLRTLTETLKLTDATSATGGEVVVSTKGGQSLTLQQMRRLERQQLLAMLRQDDDIIVALLAEVLKRGRRN